MRSPGVSPRRSRGGKLPKEAVWVVFEDVTADDWYVGQTRVSELQKKAAK